MAMGNSTRGFMAVLVLCLVAGAQASDLKFGNEFCLLKLPPLMRFTQIWWILWYVSMKVLVWLCEEEVVASCR